MFLSDDYKQLLHEIYEVSYSQETVITGGGGTVVSHALIDVQISTRSRLAKAIAEIDVDEAKAKRVGEILEEYRAIALDFSPIDRDGYKFNPARNLKRIKKALYAYTGIWYEIGGAGCLPLG